MWSGITRHYENKKRFSKVRFWFDKHWKIIVNQIDTALHVKQVAEKMNNILI